MTRAEYEKAVRPFRRGDRVVVRRRGSLLSSLEVYTGTFLGSTATQVILRDDQGTVKEIFYTRMFDIAFVVEEKDAVS